MSEPTHPATGGSYIVENGVRRLAEAPTKDHPEGNRARDAAAAPPPATEAAPEAVPPVKKEKSK